MRPQIQSVALTTRGLLQLGSLFLFLFLLLMLPFGRAAAAGESRVFDIVPDRDTYAWKDSCVDRSAWTSLRAGYAPVTDECWAYLHFDLSVIPAGWVSESAILKLYTTDAGAPDPDVSAHLVVNRVSGSWTEAGLTWCDSPAVASATRPKASVARDAGGHYYYQWDVSTILAAFLDGSATNHGLCVRPLTSLPLGQGEMFHSANATGADAGLRPKLIVDCGPRENACPVADANGPYEGWAGVPVAFQGDFIDDGWISAWDWRFGDGTRSEEENPSKAYSTPGTYEVTLQVTDDEGCVSEVDRTWAHIAALGRELTLYRVSDTTGLAHTANPGTARTAFEPGEVARVTLRATNSGPTVSVQAVLNVAPTGCYDLACYLYDSHPRNENVKRSLETNETEYYSFDLSVPSDASGVFDVLAAIRGDPEFDLIYDTTLDGPNTTSFPPASWKFGFAVRATEIPVGHRTATEGDDAYAVEEMLVRYYFDGDSPSQAELRSASEAVSDFTGGGQGREDVVDKVLRTHGIPVRELVVPTPSLLPVKIQSQVSAQLPVVLVGGDRKVIIVGFREGASGVEVRVLDPRRTATDEVWARITETGLTDPPMPVERILLVTPSVEIPTIDYGTLTYDSARRALEGGERLPSDLHRRAARLIAPFLQSGESVGFLAAGDAKTRLMATAIPSDRGTDLKAIQDCVLVDWEDLLVNRGDGTSFLCLPLDDRGWFDVDEPQALIEAFSVRARVWARSAETSSARRIVEEEAEAARDEHDDFWYLHLGGHDRVAMYKDVVKGLLSMKHVLDESEATREAGVMEILAEVLDSKIQELPEQLEATVELLDGVRVQDVYFAIKDLAILRGATHEAAAFTAGGGLAKFVRYRESLRNVKEFRGNLSTTQYTVFKYGLKYGFKAGAVFIKANEPMVDVEAAVEDLRVLKGYLEPTGAEGDLRTAIDELIEEVEGGRSAYWSNVADDLMEIVRSDVLADATKALIVQTLKLVAAKAGWGVPIVGQIAAAAEIGLFLGELLTNNEDVHRHLALADYAADVEAILHDVSYRRIRDPLASVIAAGGAPALSDLRAFEAAAGATYLCEGYFWWEVANGFNRTGVLTNFLTGIGSSGLTAHEAAETYFLPKADDCGEYARKWGEASVVWDLLEFTLRRMWRSEVETVTESSTWSLRGRVVSPGPAGDTDDRFELRIVCQEPEGVAPDEVLLCLDGACSRMAAEGSDFAGGVPYAFAAGQLARGEHEYEFRVVRGGVTVASAGPFTLRVDEAEGDLDEDGTPDSLDPDDDGDGWLDYVETAEGSDPRNASSRPTDTDNDGLGDVADTDDDNDRWNDAQELLEGSDPRNSRSVPSDADGDRIGDVADDDDDNDGYSDASEAAAGSDPGDPSSRPGSDEVSADQSTIHVTSPHTADGEDQAVATVSLRTRQGGPVSGRAASLSLAAKEGGVSFGPVAEVAPGAYESAATSTVPGAKTIEATVGSEVIRHSTAGGPDVAVVVFLDPSSERPAFVEDSRQSMPPGAGAVVWADYDGDGDADLSVVGTRELGAVPFAEIYRNDGGILSLDGRQSLFGLAAERNEGGVAWVDYDRDGWLDLVYTGSVGGLWYSKVYRKERSVLVEDDRQALMPMAGNTAWGDYDNDGDLDLVLLGWAGASYTKLYRNDAGVLVEASAPSLPGLSIGSASWGDYDEDGDADLALSGRIAGSSYRTGVFRNEGGSLVEDLASPLPGLSRSTVCWVDHDGDGDLDLAVAGNPQLHVGLFAVYRNEGGRLLEDPGFRVNFAEEATFASGDYDNDGDHDFVLAGFATQELIFYGNEGDMLVRDAAQDCCGLQLATSVDLADYDSDGDLDVAVSGFPELVKIFRNGIGSRRPNAAPSPPASGSLGSRYEGPGIVLSWDPGADGETPEPVLSYNVRVGTSAGSNDVVSGAIAVGPGNMGPRRSWRLQGLAPGRYHWSVQTVDSGFARSPWTEERSFVFGVEDCCNGVDDDGDGLTDLSDPDCSAIPCPCGRPDYELGFAETDTFYSMRSTSVEIGDAVRIVVIGRNASPLGSFRFGVRAQHDDANDILTLVEALDPSGSPVPIRMVGVDGEIRSPAIANIASTASMRIVGVEPGSAVAGLLGAGQLRWGIEERGRSAWVEFTIEAPGEEGWIESTPDVDMCFANELVVLQLSRSEVFLRGEAKFDEKLNITDAIVILRYLFLGGEEPPCLEALNCNDDEYLNLTDPVFLLRYLFLGGEEPPAPGPAGQGLPCGKDPEGSANFLGCTAFDGCVGE